MLFSLYELTVSTAISGADTYERMGYFGTSRRVPIVVSFRNPMFVSFVTRSIQATRINCGSVRCELE